MSCEISSGYTKPSCKRPGSVSSFVFINIENIGLTVTSDVVTAIASQTATAYEVKLDINSGFANHTWEGNRENASIRNVQTIMGMLKDDELATSQLAADLAKGYFLVIARKRSGKNEVYGLINGLSTTTIDYVSGQAGGDMNGFTVNMTGEEDTVPPHISNTLIGNMLSYTS
jgi:hypothetical protein